MVYTKTVIPRSVVLFIGAKSFTSLSVLLITIRVSPRSALIHASTPTVEHHAYSDSESRRLFRAAYSVAHSFDAVIAKSEMPNSGLEIRSYVAAHGGSSVAKYGLIRGKLT